MSTNVVVNVDTHSSNNDEIRVSFDSINKNGVTAAEKMLTMNILSALSEDKAFPRINKINTNSKQFSVRRENQ